MASSRVVVLLLLLLSTPAWAQTNRYMVFFQDKAGTPHTLSQPETFLSARAIQRRTKAMAQVTPEDLPVVPAYVTQVRATGAKAFFTTRWMNGVLVEATSAQLSAIQLLPFVSTTEFVAPNAQLLGGRKALRMSSSGVAAATDAQLSMLGLDSMHLDGFEGDGVMISVMDSGFPGVNSTAPFQSLRDESRILMTSDFIRNSTDVYQYDDHGTSVLSIMAAEGPSFKGGATKASYLLFVTEDVDSEYRIEEYNWLFAAERADSAGADIIQSSLGYAEFDDPTMDYTTADLDGNTAVVSRSASKARDRGIIVVASAGNLGSTPWQYITPPADTYDILSVGAVTLTGTKTSFSSIGLPGTGFIKPDVVALGTGVSAIDASGSLISVTGTSAAAPLVSSLVAGLLGAYPSTPPQSLVAHIRSTASHAQSPDNETGYGVPGYLAVKNYLDRQFGNFAFPNPVTTTLWITFGPTPYSSEIAIYDVQGRTVFFAAVPEVTWSNRTTPLDVSGLAAGIYIIRIVSVGPTATISGTFRFVKL